MTGLGVSDILNEQTAASTSASNRSAPGGALGKDEFLQLLVSQLSNQDPMNPMDGQEFAAQLAQFSSVEQLVNISDVLARNGETNGILAQSINSGVAAGLIGKNVQASGDTLAWNGEDRAPMKFDLASSAANVKISVRNEAGLVVREYELGSHTSGPHTFEWDGQDRNGATAASGNYTYDIAAVDASGSPVKSMTYTTGTVDRITFGQDGIRLWLGTNSVAMSDVSSVE